VTSTEIKKILIWAGAFLFLGAGFLVASGLANLVWIERMSPYVPLDYETDIKLRASVELIIGFILFVLGLISLIYTMKTEVVAKPTVAEPKVEGKFFCRFCGKENKPDAAYCEGCGKKL